MWELSIDYKVWNFDIKLIKIEVEIEIVIELRNERIEK